MEDNTKRIELLLDGAIEYGKTSFELAKLKATDKVSDVVSSFIPRSLVILILVSSLLFLNIGLALLIGEILGEAFYGFFVIAAFYGLVGFVFHFFMHKRLKKRVSDYIVQQILK